MTKSKLTEFEDAMLGEAKVLIREEKRSGTTRLGPECFRQLLASRMSKHQYKQGAPCGTNAAWMFAGMCDDLRAIDPVISRFVH